jgi:hypothetical protein
MCETWIEMEIFFFIKFDKIKLESGANQRLIKT